ncbi:hypothetical protein DEO72_LG11g911 [Vigna unguiculata]|uniref:Uncharacterized protein n=1 Tax=Vigna unguiculata TaxID=3917 RepID=A0A4D6NJE8_VIGUN|nr:hypothetical protein DEO72_LG11g911 [Vigna unguiculata]
MGAHGSHNTVDKTRDLLVLSRPRDGIPLNNGDSISSDCRIDDSSDGDPRGDDSYVIKQWRRQLSQGSGGCNSHKAVEVVTLARQWRL